MNEVNGRKNHSTDRSSLVALPAAAFLAWLTNHWLTPLLLRGISGPTVPAFDPEPELNPVCSGKHDVQKKCRKRGHT